MKIKDLHKQNLSTEEEIVCELALLISHEKGERIISVQSQQEAIETYEKIGKRKCIDKLYKWEV